MSSTLRVMTTPTSDTNGTTLLFQEGATQYLIGRFSEGSQRTGPCQGTKIARTRNCFLTGKTGWQSTGGFTGMLMALKRRTEQNVVESEPATRQDLTVFGPQRLSYQMATTRRFVFRKDLRVVIKEVKDRPEQPIFTDENMRVWAIPTIPTPTSTATPARITTRKRSHDESEGVDTLSSAPKQQLVLSDDLTEDEHYNLVVDGIVSEMCNTEWKVDALFPTRLADVKLPATIFIRNQVTNKTEKYHGPLPGSGGTYDPDLVVLVRKPWPGALIEDLPPLKPSKTAVSYIFRRHDKHGKFDKEKALALKITPGARYSRLTKGESVENDDGLLISPDQVLGPTQPGDSFAVIDLPSEAYIEDFLNRPDWNQQELLEGIRVMYWLCDFEILQDPRLQAFVSRFAHINHVISNSAHTGDYLANRLTSQLNACLSAIDGARFPPPTHDFSILQHQLPPNVSIAYPGQTFDLKPDSTPNNSHVLPLVDVQKEIGSIPDIVLATARGAHRAVEAEQATIKKWADSIPGKDVEITTLGTGSAEPSTFRNVSSTLLRKPGWGSMLFDCGEGTLGQLKRSFPPEEFRQILRDLRIISISHLHADHHMGLVGVINAWYHEVHYSQPGPELGMDVDVARLVGGDRLAVIAEPAMHASLREYSAIDDFGYSRIAPLVASPTHSGSQTSLQWFVPPTKVAERPPRAHTRHVAPDLLGLRDVQTAYVRHCAGARAYAFTWPDSFKVSYSGDTRPVSDFVRIGKGSTVCIHEATFDDDLLGEAEAKRHSTIGEALGVADAMDARACILTHFSQRYACGPDLARILRRLSSSKIQAYRMPVASSSPRNGAAHDVAGDELPQDGPSVFDEDAEAIPVSGAAVSARARDRYDLRPDLHIGLGLDMMRVKVGQIPELKFFLPAIGELMNSLKQARDDAAAQYTRALDEKAAEKLARKMAAQTAHNSAKSKANGTTETSRKLNGAAMKPAE